MSTPSKNFPPGASLLAILAVIGALAAASFITVVPQFKTQPAGVTPLAGIAGGQFGSGDTGGGAGAADAGGSTTTGGKGGKAGSAGSAGKSGGKGAGATPTPGTLQCNATGNGGNTDTGVSASEIKLASTVAESGIASSFLGDVRFGMEAAVNATNNAGGVCGRKLNLTLADDGWNTQTGEQDIKNFIAQGYFALPVVPSSNGLNGASIDGVIDNAGIPVVGTDGMLYTQYKDPWIWPVASSTISTAHIAAETAYQAGARTFGIVYDSNYAFGVEGHAAFAGEINRLPGAKLVADYGVTSGQGNYSGTTFNTGCESVGGCDMTFVLLEPDTADTWFSTATPDPPKKLLEGPQPLFVDTFGSNCGQTCNNMVVWTSYFPDRPPFNGQPAVSGYVNAIRSVSASADVDNQFLEGGYYGMEMFVQALKAVGPGLTRAALKTSLDSLTFSQGLAQSMTWSSGNHFANTSMLGFSIQYSGGFNGFQYLNTGWVTDPCIGCDKP
jgi:ABC-type branched-subunit amino acid transport system substrate-binding protein